MKRIFKHTIALIAGLASFQTMSTAQEADYTSLRLFKDVSLINPNDLTKYEVTLEAFVTGKSVISSSVKPVDIVLVLDASTSMNNTIPEYEYTARNSQYYTPSMVRNNTYYYSPDNGENFYQVQRGGSEGHRYIYYTAADGTRQQLGGEGRDNENTWNGVLYTRRTVSNPTKISLLKTAAKSFIDIVAESAKGADNTAGTKDDIDHKISIVTFSEKADNKTDGKLLNVNSNYSTLTDIIDNKIVLANWTSSDRGMEAAKVTILPAKDTSRSRVVVMFTDGVPCRTSGSGTTFEKNVAEGAIAQSLAMKSDGVTVYTIGIFDSETDNIKTYMNRVSSNYPNASGMDNDEGGTPADTKYYQLSNGANLSSIFQKIAEESVADVIKLDANTTTVLDVVSSNFIIPEEVKSKDIDIKIYDVDEYKVDYKDVEYKEETGGKTYYWGYSFKTAATAITPAPTPVRDGNSVTVNGFDFTKADTFVNNELVPGNWVGGREIQGTGGTTETVYAGRKIVIKFPITLSPDYQGGYAMPSNESTSGIYVNGKQVKPFPIPHVDYPSLCIVKHGLQAGESAIFEVTGPENVKYNVALTQKKKSDGTLAPCYIVLKRLETGTYTVKELNWSWMYNEANATTAPTISFEVLPADQVGITTATLLAGSDLENSGNVIGKKASKVVKSVSVPFVMIKDSEGTYDSAAISVLYEFTNTRNTAGKPARGEGWSNNRLAGGTLKTGSTENGILEE